MKFTLTYTLAFMLPMSQAFKPSLAGNTARMIRDIARGVGKDGVPSWDLPEPKMRAGDRKRREALNELASTDFMTAECDADCKRSFRSYVDRNSDHFLSYYSASYLGVKTTRECDWTKVVPHSFYTGSPPSSELLTKYPMSAIDHCVKIQVKEDPEEWDLRFSNDTNTYIHVHKLEMKFQAVEFTCVDENGIEFGVTAPVMVSLEIPFYILQLIGSFFDFLDSFF